MQQQEVLGRRLSALRRAVDAASRVVGTECLNPLLGRLSQSVRNHHTGKIDLQAAIRQQSEIHLACVLLPQRDMVAQFRQWQRKHRIPVVIETDRRRMLAQWEAPAPSDLANRMGPYWDDVRLFRAPLRDVGHGLARTANEKWCQLPKLVGRDPRSFLKSA
jgi:hypothetical protein